jgi:hypothetical protein
MDGESSQKCRLRKALNVPGMSRPFQAVKTDDLALWRGNWPMLVDENAVLPVNSILSSSGGKTLLVHLPRPEVTGNGQ